MEEKTLKQIADELMQKKGNVRGEVFRISESYIREKKGEEGIKAVEEKLEDLGYPFHFSDIKPLGWYQEGLSVLIILATRELFAWTEKDIFDWGNFAPKVSFLNKMFIKYFVSLKRILEESPKYWQTHFDFGELLPVDVDEKERRVVIRVKGYEFDPLICSYHAGYFQRIISFSVRSKHVSVKETKCVHKGDAFHEYLMQWN